MIKLDRDANFNIKNTYYCHIIVLSRIIDNIKRTLLI